MKKLLCMAAALFCLTACGGSAEDKNVTCTSKATNTGYNVESTIDFTYAGNTVKKQEQKAVMKVDDKATYDQVKPIMEAASQEETVKGMEGVTYKLDFNDTEFTINESIKIDTTKISTEDYATLTGQASSAVKTMKIDMEKTRENMEKNGMTCSAMD